MTLTERVLALLVARAGQWVDGRELAQVGGYAAWRSRVSDARRRLPPGARIENVVERRPDLTVTRYRYLPPERLF